VTPGPAMVGWEALEPARLETGDIVHVQGDNFVSRDIRRSERSPGEGISWASHTEHVLIAAADGAVDMSVNGGRPRVIPFTFWRGRGRVLVTRKPGGLAAGEKEGVIGSASGALWQGLGYGWIKLVAHKGDWWLSQSPLARWLHLPPVLFRRLCCLDDWPICSYDTARRYWDVCRIRFNGLDYRVVQPDDILDHCVKQLWPVVFADSDETFLSFKGAYELAAASPRATGEIVA